MEPGTKTTYVANEAIPEIPEGRLPLLQPEAAFKGGLVVQVFSGQEKFCLGL